MPVVVTTRMHTRGWREAMRLVRLTAAVKRQLAGQPGFLGGAVLAEPRRVFWTVSVWQDPASLAAFRELHAEVASHGEALADSMVNSGWRADSDTVPTWREVGELWPAVPAPRRGVSAPVRSGRRVRRSTRSSTLRV